MKNYIQLTYGLPCILSKISFLVNVESKLPFIEESLLKFVKILNNPTLSEMKSLLLLSSDELSYLINSALDKNLIVINNSTISLTTYSESLFKDNEDYPTISESELFSNESVAFNAINLENITFQNDRNHSMGEISSTHKFSNEIVNESFLKSFNMNANNLLEKFNLDKSSILIGVTESRLEKYFKAPVLVDYYVDFNGKDLIASENITNNIDNNRNSNLKSDLQHKLREKRELDFQQYDISFNKKPLNFLRKFFNSDCSDIISNENRITSSFLMSLPNNISTNAICYFGHFMDLDDDIFNNAISKNTRLDNPIFWFLPNIPLLYSQPSIHDANNIMKETWTNRFTPIINKDIYFTQYKKYSFERQITYNKTKDMDYIEIISLYDHIGIFVLYFFISKNFPLLPVTFILEGKNNINKLFKFLVDDLSSNEIKLDGHGDFGKQLTQRIKSAIFTKLYFK
jgi:hypothetical protein